MTADWSFEVGVAPDDALERIAAAINQRPKRAFGVLKTRNEFVGVVKGTEFEIWERRQRAVHAIGNVRRDEPGTRIELRFVMSARTWILLFVFFTLYVLAAVGFAVQPPGTDLSAQEFMIAVAGLAVLIAAFAAAAWRQRADLRAFLQDLFDDIPLG